MTRKHFKALAEALRSERPQDNCPAEESDERRSQWNHDVLAIAVVCKSFNGLFKRDRFLEACGGLYDFSTRESSTVYSLTGRHAA